MVDLTKRGRTRDPPRMRAGIRDSAFIRGDENTWRKKISGLFLDLIRNTVCMTLYHKHSPAVCNFLLTVDFLVAQ